MLLAAAVSWSVASASGRAAEWARDYERVFCSGLAAHFAGYFALGCHVGLELRARGSAGHTGHRHGGDDSASTRCCWRDLARLSTLGRCTLAPSRRPDRPFCQGSRGRESENGAGWRMLVGCFEGIVSFMSAYLPAVILSRPVGWEGPSMSEGGFVLPSGTVTLLLGDVEGSTRAWEADAKTTAVAVDELNELVDELVGRCDGVRPVEQGEGDSFVAAFARARDGIACALSLQRALVGGVLRVRMGLHTGDVVRRDEGNYVGPAIIRAARLRNLAHGGQTVLSEATRELVIDALPEGVGLRDLGVHRLKDLSRPERVFQLCHPDLPSEFPSLRSLDAHPHNLPMQRTTFVGRSAEITTVIGLLADEPLVTLTGSGGCGKTRLGLQVAAEVLERFGDGVWFVDLAAVADDEGVAGRAAQSLGVVAGPGMSSTDAMVAQLRTSQALLVLDNCEHVSDAAAALVDAVLSGCSAVRVVATSRQPLGIAGEVVWRVPSLSLPADDGPVGIEGLSRSEAVQLFVERATRSRAGFRLDGHNHEAVVQICRRLDGIPLGIGNDILRWPHWEPFR